MRADVVPPSELSDRLLASWARLQSRNPVLHSPFFSPSFIATAAECRPGVLVGILRDGNQVIGFFPHERRRFRRGGPVAGRISDYHGVVSDPDADWNARELVSACGLKVWQFDHLPAEQTAFAPHVVSTAGSPMIDVSAGFAEYRLDRRRAGKGRIDQFLRKSRKLRRECPDLRFEFASPDPEALDTVIEWKRQQCRRTGTFDFFARRDYQELARRIHGLRDPSCSGVLSVLRVGDAIVAAHLGMRSERTLHWWFPVYDHRFGHYSPGGILLLEILRGAEENGIGLVDLGKGHDAYKRSFMTHETAVAKGEVVLPSLVGVAYVTRRRSIEVLRTSPWTRKVSVPARAFRRLLKGRRGAGT